MQIKEGYVYKDSNEDQWRVNSLSYQSYLTVAELECLAGGHMREELTSELDRWYLVSR